MARKNDFKKRIGVVYSTEDSYDYDVEEEFEEEDIEDNQRIKVRSYYGERENSLVKILEGTFDVILKGIDYLFYGLLVVITILVFLIIWKRHKKKSEENDLSEQIKSGLTLSKVKEMDTYINNEKLPTTRKEMLLYILKNSHAKQKQDEMSSKYYSLW